MAKTVCIIPARGGSKRIPGKNIKDFLGKPIIKYPIEAAKASGVFDDIFVYTDSQEIKDVIKDDAKILDRFIVSDDQTLAEAMLKLDLSDYDIICVILPTAIFINDFIIKISFDNFIKATNMDSFNVVLDNKDMAVEWGRDRNGKLYFKNYFVDAGQFYFVRKDAFLKQKSLICFKHNINILSQGIDLNTEEDWINAENLYKSTRVLGR